MTVQSSLARASYTIAGAGPYAIPFYFLADADIIAIRTPVGGGTPITLTLTTHYTLSGAADEDGGALTLIGAAIVNGDTLTIINEPPILQLTQYPETGKFPAASHERALDKLTMIAKRVYDLASRSLRLDDGDTATSLELPLSSPGKLIGWDSGGNLTNTSPTAVGSGSIGTTEIADGAVTTAKIADPTLVALAALNSTAGLVEQTGADTFTKRAIGTAPGNVPLVGTKSATTTLAGLVELAIQAEAEAGTDNTVVMTPLTTAQAIAALTPGGVGSGQTWTDVSASRAMSTNYTNSTGKPILVSIRCNNGSAANYSMTVDSKVVSIVKHLASDGVTQAAFVLVQNGEVYSIAPSAGTALNITWYELR